MSETSTFALMETCVSLGRATDAASLATLLAHLRSPHWPVRYAAAVALGDRRDVAAVSALMQALCTEDAAPLYSQPDDLCHLPAGAPGRVQVKAPAGTTAETLEAWRRRGRIKQAICWTLAAIGPAAAPAAGPVLRRYATDQKEDYAVRAAACRALGCLRDPEARAALEEATHDGEWCTATEARKAVTALGASRVNAKQVS